MRVKLIIGSVLLLIAGYSVFWFQMAGRVEQTVLEWIENSEARLGGIKIYVGDVSVTGFPYRIIIGASSLNAVIPAGRIAMEPVSVTVPEVMVIFQPWKPNHAIVVTDYFDAVLGSLNNPTINFSVDKVKSSIVIEPTSLQLNNLSIIADKVSWYHGLAKAENDSSVLHMAEFHLRRATGEVPDQISFDLPVNRAIFFKAQNASIKEFEASILGEKADNIKFEALLHANEQPDYTVNGLSKWRDEGGTLSIRSFEYGTNNSGLKLSGDMTLDENLKPLGAFDATVTGMENMLATLSQNENISDMARLLLGSQAQSGNLPAEVPLSISMQNGLLYLGPIMLMELPAVIE